MSNIRPIGDPGLATAMLATFQSIDRNRAAAAAPSGLSEPRWRILQCAHEAGEAGATFKALQLCSGLNARALAEHVQALRWKGFMAMDSYRLSASAALMVGEHMAPTIQGKTGTAITDEAALFTPPLMDITEPSTAPVLIGFDIASGPDVSFEATVTFGADGKIAKIEPHLPMDPADVPACMRPDCMPPSTPVPTPKRKETKRADKHGRGSAAVARPDQGAVRCDRVATDRITGHVAGSNPAPAQPKTTVADLTPELIASLRAGMPARQVPPPPQNAELKWSGGRHEMREDAWQSAARHGSALLIEALRRHHPERCGGA